MRSDARPGVYGLMTRTDTHLWRPNGERVFNNDLLTTGHQLIDSYAPMSAGRMPAWLEGAELTPGEFMVNVATEAAENRAETFGLLHACGFGRPDAVQEDACWDVASDALENHTPIAPAGLDAAHYLWQRRVAQGYNTEGAQKFRARADEYMAGFVEGAILLIRSGRFPLAEQEFAARLQAAPEIAYVPSYVLRLVDLAAGGRGAYTPFSACSDRSIGALFFDDTIRGRDRKRCGFMHEATHYFLDGALTLDMVKDNGQRIPYERDIGLWRLPVSTDPRAAENAIGVDSTSVGLEVNEGATDLIVEDIHLVLDGLGRFRSIGGYKAWLGLLRHMESRGMDMTPLLGYKMADDFPRPMYTKKDMYYGIKRVHWQSDMYMEYDRVFNPRRRDELNWDVFTAAVSHTAQSKRVAHDDDPTPYISLLHEPSRWERRNPGEWKFSPGLWSPWGQHRLAHGGQVKKRYIKGNGRTLESGMRYYVTK